MPTRDRTIHEIYANELSNLSEEEQLRLAALILNNLTRKETSNREVSYSDTWTEEDMQDIASFSLQNGAVSYEAEESDR
ncbi:MAG: hypothetical protein AAGA60_10695 [Cyanobacteria bacterium P01_E01_bin.42]